MNTIRRQNARAAVMSLEDEAASARGGFACVFSTADEYETALIAERRAQGHYGRQRNQWSGAVFTGLALLIAGTVLFFH